MANKVTKREVINGLMNGAILPTDEVAIAYFENELAILDKRNANRKETKAQVENKGIKDTIVSVLGAEPMTISEIQKADPSLSDYSGQKMSALLKQLVDSEVVKKSYDKKTPMFSI